MRLLQTLTVRGADTVSTRVYSMWQPRARGTPFRSEGGLERTWGLKFDAWSVLVNHLTRAENNMECEENML